MAEYKTIIFDLSEVLISGLLFFEEEFSRDYGVPADSIFAAFGGEIMQDYFRGMISEDEYLRIVIEKSSWPVSLPALKKLLRKNYQYRLPGMQPILDYLKEDHELVLLSDHGREWVAFILQEHPFLSVFDKKFFSFEIDGLKRYPETFEKLLKALHRKSAECLFIDDMERNCEAARFVGIDAIRFTCAEDLVKDLHLRGIPLPA